MPIIASSGSLVEFQTTGISIPSLPPGNFGNSSYWGSAANINKYLGIDVQSSTLLQNFRNINGYTLEYYIYSDLRWPVVQTNTANPGPGERASGTLNPTWSFGPTLNGQLELYYWNPGARYITTKPYTMNLNTWYNICMVVTTSGTSSVSLYINGIRQKIQLNNSGVFLDSIAVGGVFNPSLFSMGRNNLGWWNGYIDNLRISSINRYSGPSYTLATQPFTNDANTLLLMTMDGPNGSSTFTDLSSYNRTITNVSNLVTISNAKNNHSQ